MTSALQPLLRERQARIEALLRQCLRRAAAPSDLNAAMEYAVLGGGKRLRPQLAYAAAEAAGADYAAADIPACAVELIHAYSLIHDDLPCMDDDDYRRGRLTCHKKFDEATAVLAGDALLTLAFEILAHPDTHPSAEVRCQLVALLARAGGSEGMIGGQMMDIDAPNRSHTADEIILLQRMKTGALFEFSCEAGAILAERGPEDRERLRGYARDFGLAFQITDDLIDVTSSAEAAGKAVGKDQDQGKATLISLYGADEAEAKAVSLAQSAADAVAVYGPAADALRALPFYLIGRET